MYVTVGIRGVVLKFTPEGKHLATIGRSGEQPHQFGQPWGIAIDSNDIMYITDESKHQVMMFTTEGEFFGRLGDPEKQVFYPRGVAVDKTGNVYVCDEKSGEVLMSRP